MRYLVLSDVHANAVALEAVLRHAGQRRWESVVFLGDAVGYYTEPERAVRRLRDLSPEVALLGNHDAVLLGEAGRYARSLVVEVLSEHRRELSEGSLGFLEGLQPRAVKETFEAVHGALSGRWTYLSTVEEAQENLPLMTRELLFFGHTHVPVAYVYLETPKGPRWQTVALTEARTVYHLPPGARVLFNPGSVGQPRDGIPLASYAIFDEDACVLEHLRVPFDIPKVQGLVKAAGYPDSLAARLEVGQ